MTKTLVERLVRERHTREDWHEPYGTISLPCDADDYGAEAHLINPDGPEAAAEITRLASRIEELERKLKPFAEAGATLSSRWEDHETHWQGALSYPISAGQLRAARSALSDKG
jgi:hypothetical protein